jgi:adenylate cyclase
MKTVTPQAGTHLRVSITFGGQARQKSFHKSEITIGRANGVAKPDLDLSPDVNVSRRHARLWIEDGDCWIEDLGSKFGTQVDGEPVYPGLKAGVKADSAVQIGDTALRIECVDGERELSGETQFNLAPALEVSESIDANVRGFDLAKTATPEVMARQALLLELPLEFSAPANLNALLQVIVKRAVEAIPGAKRGTVLLRRGDSEALVLAAFVSDEEPVVSETLARRTLAEQKGFIWRCGSEEDTKPIGSRQRLESGMYAPLLCQGAALGVICVDNPYRNSAFSDDDLRLLVTIAHQAAVFIAYRQGQDGLRDSVAGMERLLTTFSPKLRTRLLNKAREGRLVPHVEKSEVTVLLAEIRGLTVRSADMDSADVLEMTNQYFPALSEAIFAFDGAIDKWAGDTIQAVFGSPETDDAQHEKAIRAAWAMQEAIREINAERMGNEEPICELSVGIHCGEAVHGFVGVSERLQFTVIGGDTVMASRFSSGARAGEILLSAEVHQRTATLIQVEKVSVPASQGELPAYRVNGFHD